MNADALGAPDFRRTRVFFGGASAMSLRRLAGVAALLLIGGGCATSNGAVIRQECDQPDRQLAALLDRLYAAPSDGCQDRARVGRPPCAELRREIERLAVVCPTHVPSLMATALIAYEAGQSARAQQFLDQIFERPRSYPVAAVLRTQIAIEDGNLPFARRFVEEQIRFTPDHPGLREMHGAVLYLTGQFDEARKALADAEALGAPAWRVAYHTGLLEEAAGHRDAAIKAYGDAIERNPSYAPAISRFNALKVGTP
jgi:tetratricopeptide (TPR) repeat protein